LIQKDSDTRERSTFDTAMMRKESNSESQYLLNEPEIFIDDIQTAVNAAIIAMYPIIREKIAENMKRISSLSSLFLLNKNVVDSITFKIGEPEEKILEKVYTIDARISAKRDAEIEKCISSLDEIDPSADDSKEKLDGIIDELVRVIPQQNRLALTHYVARRKLVLKLF